MNERVTIELDEAALLRLRAAAEAQGIAIEVYLQQLIAANLPIEVAPSQQRLMLAKIFGMGTTSEPTDIAKDKDKLIGEAVWEEYLRETKQG